MVIDMKIRALVMRTGTFILWSKKQRYCNLPNDVSTTSADLKPRICLNGERIQERGLRHTKFKLKLSPIHNKPMLLIWSLAHPLPLQSSQGPCTAWDCSNLLAAMALNWLTTLVSPFNYTTFNTLSESCSGFVYGSRIYILLNPSHKICWTFLNQRHHRFFSCKWRLLHESVLRVRSDKICWKSSTSYFWLTRCSRVSTSEFWLMSTYKAKPSEG